MWSWFAKYWDIISGILTGLGLAVVSNFQLDSIQLLYSIVILLLVSIGFFKIVKQAVEKQKEKKAKERERNLIDNMVDGQKAVKAINIASEPTKEGEKIGNLFINIMEVLKGIMNKFTQWFDKVKGYLLTIALAVLTVVEMYGGFINQLCGGVLVINGVEVLPLVTLVASVVVGIISNGYTKEQKEKIKALFSKSSTDEIVLAEIKKTLKENEAKVKEFGKVLSTKKMELDNLNSELEAKNNTLSAKREMSVMTPRLATDEDVHLAEIAVKEVEDKIKAKKAEIAEVETSIANLNSTISALKSQL